MACSSLTKLRAPKLASDTVNKWVGLLNRAWEHYAHSFNLTLFRRRQLIIVANLLKWNRQWSQVLNHCLMKLNWFISSNSLILSIRFLKARHQKRKTRKTLIIKIMYFQKKWTNSVWIMTFYLCRMKMKKIILLHRMFLRRKSWNIRICLRWLCKAKEKPNKNCNWISNNR